jgi:hypothetical protein
MRLCVGVIGFLTAQGARLGGGFSCEWSFRRTSKILFGNIVEVNQGILPTSVPELTIQIEQRKN